MESSSSIESHPMHMRSPERRQQKMDAFFERRERQAHAIIAWIRKLEQIDISEEYWAEKTPMGDPVKSWDEKYVQEHLQSDLMQLSPEMQTGLTNVWYKWANGVRNAKIARQHILEKGEEGSESKSDEEQGRDFFYNKVGVEPAGKVRFFQKGPFYYFAFEKTEDYDQFIKACGSSGYRGEGGVHLSRVWWAGTAMIPTLAQVGRRINHQILVHEGEHYLHHGLGDAFAAWEAEDKTRSKEVVRAERDLKDELLAYLRDGRRVDDIYSILTQSELYAHLYDQLTVSQERAVRAKIQDICQALKHHPWLIVFSSVRDQIDQEVDKHRREMMVASLLDVPLSKMEKYIRFSAEHYRRRAERGEISLPPLEIGPGASQEEQAAYRKEWDRFVQQYNKMLGLMPEYGLPATEERELMRLEQAIKDVPPSLPGKEATAHEKQMKQAETKVAAWKTEKGVSRRIDYIHDETR